MPYPRFDRHKLLFKPLAERENRTSILTDHIPVTRRPGNTSRVFQDVLQETAQRVRTARAAHRPVNLEAFR